MIMKPIFRIKKYVLAAIAVSTIHIINPIKAETSLSPTVTTQGMACNILNTPSGKKRWSILQYDLDEGADNSSVVYSTKHDKVIQSVACNSDGSQVLVAMQARIGENTEIFLLETSEPNTPIRLTENSVDDLDVAMSDDGSIMVWQSELADGREAVTIRSQQIGGNYNTIQLSSQYDYNQPSLSSNGKWLVMLQNRPKTTQVVRYELSSQTYTILATFNNGRRQPSTPSISDDGSKVLWLEVGAEQKLVLTDIAANQRYVTLRRELNGNLIEHPSLTGDGKGILYSVNGKEKRQTFLHFLATEQTIRLGNHLYGESRYLANQLHANIVIKGGVTELPFSSVNYTSYQDIAKGSDNSIYVLGRKGGGAGASFIVKYDAGGNELWREWLLVEETTNIPVIQSVDSMFFTSIEVNDEGEIYLSGIAETTEKHDGDLEAYDGYYRSFLSKYTTDRKKSWTRFVEEGSYHESESLVLAKDGGAYLITDAYIGFSADELGDFTCLVPGCYPAGVDGVSFFQYFDENGDKQYNKVFHGGMQLPYGWHGIENVVVGPNGSIYLTAYKHHARSYYYNWENWEYSKSLIKLDEASEFVWEKPIAFGYDYDGRFGQSRVNVDESGGIYVTFNPSRLMGEQYFGESDVAVMRLNANGEILSTAQFGTSADESVRDTQVDKDGNLYVIGTTQGSLPGFQNKGEEYDIFVSKYNFEGALINSNQFGSKGRDKVYASMFDGNSSLFLLGYTSDLQSLDVQGETSSGHFLMNFILD